MTKHYQIIKTKSNNIEVISFWAQGNDNLFITKLFPRKLQLYFPKRLPALRPPNVLLMTAIWLTVLIMVDINTCCLPLIICYCTPLTCWQCTMLKTFIMYIFFVFFNNIWCFKYLQFITFIMVTMYTVQCLQCLQFKIYQSSYNVEYYNI